MQTHPPEGGARKQTNALLGTLQKQLSSLVLGVSIQDKKRLLFLEPIDLPGQTHLVRRQILRRRQTLEE